MSHPLSSPLRDALIASIVKHCVGKDVMPGMASAWASNAISEAVKAVEASGAVAVLTKPPGWDDAYAAFHGAFDTPVARRHDSSDFANDARSRLREVNEQLKSLPSAQSQA